MIILTNDGEIPSKMGNSFNITGMAQAFNSLGYEVELVTLFSFPLLRRRLAIKNIYDYYGISKNIKIKTIPVFNRDVFNKAIFAAGYNEKVLSYSLKRKPKFMYCRSYITPFLSVQHEIPTIIETHTTNYSHPDLSKIYSIAHNKNFLGLITINEKIKEEHVKRGIPSNKVLVLEDGVDDNIFNINDDKLYWRNKFKLPLKKKIVLYCGSLYKLKGIEDILLCAKNLQDYDDILFLIVGGRDDHRIEWIKYTRTKKISNVNFIGFVDHIDVPKYLKAADVLIMPYDLSKEYNVLDVNTTSPIKLFEYMASKRPIISTKIPVIEKIVKDKESAFLSEPNNINNIKELVLYALNNSDKSNEVAERAYQIVKEYTWEKRCETIIKKLIDT